MVRADVITLVADVSEVHGVTETHSETQRTVFANIFSAGVTETYQLLALGMTPEFVFELPQSFEYHGEKKCIYKNKTYRVARAALRGDAIRLTVTL